MQKNIGQLDVSVNNSQLPNVTDALHNLSHDQSRFVLGKCFFDSQHLLEIKTIAQLLNHVDVGVSFDRCV